MAKRTAKVLNNAQVTYDTTYAPDGVLSIPRSDIQKDLVQFILHIEEKDVSSSLIYNLFGDFGDGVICNPYDIIYIPKGLYGPDEKHKNTNVFTTTVGLWIYNRWCFEKELHHVTGYVNKTIKKGVFKDINQQLSYALLEDKITVAELKHYLEKTQKIMPFEIILAPNLDSEMLNITEKLNKKTKKLFEEHKEALDNGDVVVAERLINEILDYAKEELKDAPSIDNYDAGTGASWGNFKAFFISKGMMWDDATGEFKMVRSNFIDGVSAEDYATSAASMTLGVYSRNKKTADGGYFSKLLTSAYQHIKIGPKGSDCGSTHYIEVTLDKNNINLWMYSFIVEGNKLVELTSDNVDKYLGKKVKFRFSSMCKSKDYICNACAGNLFNSVGVINIGISESQVAERLKNAMLNAFHDTEVKNAELDPIKAFNI